MNSAVRDHYKGINIFITKEKAWEEHIVDGKLKFIAAHPAFSTNLMDFERQVCRMKFTPPYRKGQSSGNMRDDLEKTEIPYLVYSFYHFIVQFGHIPTLEQVTDHYLNINCEKVEKGIYRFKKCFKVKGNPIFSSKAIKGRMYRSIFSYIRELHLLFSLMKYEEFKVSYIFQADLDGLDIAVEYNGQTVFIRSYVDTRRSLNWKNGKKNKRHKSAYDEKKIIDAPACGKGEKKNCKMVGQVYVNDDSSVKYIYNKVIEMCTAG